MPIEPIENIVRAVCSDKWDEERLSPSLFEGTGVSVSRLALIPLDDHWDMFRKHVEKPPARRLERIAEINVGTLQEIGRNYAPAVALTVEPKPENWNPAHAEIEQKITKGLSRKIKDAVTLHAPPAAEA